MHLEMHILAKLEKNLTLLDGLNETGVMKNFAKSRSVEEKKYCFN